MKKLLSKIKGKIKKPVIAIIVIALAAVLALTVVIAAPGDPGDGGTGGGGTGGGGTEGDPGEDEGGGNTVTYVANHLYHIDITVDGSFEYTYESTEEEDGASDEPITSVTKIWEDDADHSSDTVTLYLVDENGEYITDSNGDNVTVILSADNNWTCVINYEGTTIEQIAARLTSGANSSDTTTEDNSSSDDDDYSVTVSSYVYAVVEVKINDSTVEESGYTVTDYDYGYSDSYTSIGSVKVTAINYVIYEAAVDNNSEESSAILLYGYYFYVDSNGNEVYPTASYTAGDTTVSGTIIDGQFVVTNSDGTTTEYDITYSSDGSATITVSGTSYTLDIDGSYVDSTGTTISHLQTNYYFTDSDGTIYLVTEDGGTYTFTKNGQSYTLTATTTYSYETTNSSGETVLVTGTISNDTFTGTDEDGNTYTQSVSSTTSDGYSYYYFTTGSGTSQTTTYLSADTTYTYSENGTTSESFDLKYGYYYTTTDSESNITTVVAVTKYAYTSGYYYTESTDSQAGTNATRQEFFMGTYTTTDSDGSTTTTTETTFRQLTDFTYDSTFWVNLTYVIYDTDGETVLYTVTTTVQYDASSYNDCSGGIATNEKGYDAEISATASIYPSYVYNAPTAELDVTKTVKAAYADSNGDTVYIPYDSEDEFYFEITSLANPSHSYYTLTESTDSETNTTTYSAGSYTISSSTGSDGTITYTLTTGDETSGYTLSGSDGTYTYTAEDGTVYTFTITTTTDNEGNVTDTDYTLTVTTWPTTSGTDEDGNEIKITYTAYVTDADGNWVDNDSIGSSSETDENGDTTYTYGTVYEGLVVTLGAGETLHIIGLVDGAVYEITELGVAESDSSNMLEAAVSAVSSYLSNVIETMSEALGVSDDESEESEITYTMGDYTLIERNVDGNTYTADDENENDTAISGSIVVTYNSETSSYETTNNSLEFVNATDSKAVENEDGEDADGTDLAVGDELTYTILWVNNAVDDDKGATSATVEITDTIQTGLEYVSASFGSIVVNGTTYTATETEGEDGTVTYTYSGLTYTDSDGNTQSVSVTVSASTDDDGNTTVTWTVANAPADSYGYVTLTVEVTSEAVLEDEINNTATVKIGDNSYSTNTTTNTVSGKTVTTTNENKETEDAAGGLINVGDELTYVISWTNDTDDSATVTIEDSIPSGTEYESASYLTIVYDGVTYKAVESSTTSGSYTFEDESGNTLTYDGTNSVTATLTTTTDDDTVTKVTWTIQNAPAGSHGTVQLVVKVTEDAYDTENNLIENSATVNVGNNSSVYTVTNGVPEKDVYATTEGEDGTYTAGSVSIDGQTVGVGDVLEYRIYYTNSTDSEATVTVTDKIPTGTSFDENGNGFSPASGSITFYDKDGNELGSGTVRFSWNGEKNTLTWTIEGVPAGYSGYVSYQVTVTEAAINIEGNLIDNTASVSLNNDPSVYTNTVENKVPEKTAENVTDPDDSALNLGDIIKYTVSFEVTSELAESSSGITVIDTLETGLEYYNDATSESTTYATIIKINSADESGSETTSYYAVISGTNSDGDATYTIYTATYDESTNTYTIGDALSDGPITFNLSSEYASSDEDDSEESLETQTLTWVFTDLSEGDYVTITFYAQVNMESLTSVTNSATVNGHSTNMTTTPTDDESYKTVTDSDGTNIDGTQVSVGDILTYTILWVAETDGTVIVTDTIPDGTVLYGEPSAGGSYNPSTNTITWTFTDQVAGAKGEVSFQVEVVGFTGDGNTISNTAYVNNSATNTVENYVPNKEQTNSDLDEKEELEKGDVLDYEVSFVVSADLAESSSGITVTDTLAQGLEYLTSADSTDSVTYYDQYAILAVETTTVTQTPSEGEDGTVTYTGETETSTEYYKFTTTTSTNENGEETTTYVVYKVTKTTDENGNVTYTEGDVVTTMSYKFSTKKTTSTDDDGLTVTNEVLTWVFYNLTGASETTSTDENGVITTTTVVPTMTIYFQVLVTGSTTAYANNQATVGGHNSDITTTPTDTDSEKSVSADTDGDGTTDIEDADGDLVGIGSLLTYTIDWANAYQDEDGVYQSASVTITDYIPEGTELYYTETGDDGTPQYAVDGIKGQWTTAKDDDGGNITENIDGVEYTVYEASLEDGGKVYYYTGSNKLVWELGLKAAGAKGTVSFTVIVTEEATENSSVTYYTYNETTGTWKETNEDDENTIVNQASVTFTVENDSQTTYTNKVTNTVPEKTATSDDENVDEGEIAIGDEITYTISFTATENAESLTITDSIPEGLTLKSIGTITVGSTEITITENEDGTYTSSVESVAKVEVSNGTITWTIYGVSSGNEISISFTATVTSLNVTELENNATVKIGDNEYETNTTVTKVNTTNLTVTKNVENSNDSDKEFGITITLSSTDSDVTLAGTYYAIITTPAAEEGGEATTKETTVEFTSNSDGTASATVTLTADQYITIYSLPAGTTYTVSETAPSGYTATYENQTGKLAEDTSSSATVTNKYTANLEYSETTALEITKTFETNAASLSSEVSSTFTFTVEAQGGTNTTAEEAATLLANGVSSGGVKTDTLTLTKTTVSVSDTIELKEIFSSLTFTQGDDGKTYVYEISEKSGDSAYITYDSSVYVVSIAITDNNDGTLTVVTTVEKDGEPYATYASTTGEDTTDSTITLAFTNTYNTGSLKITKTVTGTTDTSKSFTFNVTLTDNDNTALSGTYAYTVYDSNDTQSSTGTITSGGTLSLTAGQYAIIEGLPVGASYAITETNIPSGYTKTSSSNASGTITSNEISASFENDYTAGPTEVTLTATKVTEGYVQSGGEFTFVLINVNNKTETYTATNVVTNNPYEALVSFTLTFEEAGTYTYTLHERYTTEAGMVYDRKVYTVEYVVTDDGNGKLVATAMITSTSTNDEVEDVVFTNSYNPEEIKISISGIKNINDTTDSGRTPQTGEFTFSLVEVDEDGNEVEDGISMTTTNTGSAFTFSDICTFTEPGVKYFKITEVEGDATGMTYSTQSYIVKVTVTGTNVLTATYSLDTEEITFTNTYEPDVPEKDVQDADGESVDGDMVGVGDTLTYVISWVNSAVDSETGANAAATVTITDTVPEGTTLVEGSISNDGVYDSSTGEITWTISAAAAKTGTVSFSVTVDDSAIEKIENGATVQIDDDPSQETNTTTNPKPVKTVEDSEENSAAEALVGDVLTYTISYANTGDEAVDITITDEVPDGTEYVDGSASDGGVYDAGTDTVTWTFEAAANTSGTVSFKVTVTEDAIDTSIENEATVKIGENEYSTNTVTTEVKSANLTISKTVEGTFIYNDQEFTFTITATDAEGNALSGTYDTEDQNGNDGTITFTEGTATVILKDGESLTIYNLPEGTLYTVTETAVSGYTAKATMNDTAAELTTLTDAGGQTTGYSVSGDLEADAAEVVAFTNTYKSVLPEGVSLEGLLNKVLSGRDWTEKDSFIFTLTPDDDDNPMPVDEDGNVVDTVTVTSSAAKDGESVSFGFGEIYFTEEDMEGAELDANGYYEKTFTYYITEENADKTINGVTYSTNVATLKITIVDDGAGNLTGTAVITVGNNTFTNIYESDLDYSTAGGLYITKTLYGRAMTAGQFEFTITAKDSDTVTAAEAGEKLFGESVTSKTYTNTAAADGGTSEILVLAGEAVTFDESEAGNVYVYTVSETTGGGDGYTNDTTVYTVTIEITDNGDGTLTATTTVSDGEGYKKVYTYTSGNEYVDLSEGSIAVIPFTNYYGSTGNLEPYGDVQIEAKKTMEGRSLVDGEFTFYVADANGRIVATGTNDTDGNITFTNIVYTSESLEEAVEEKTAVKDGDSYIFEYTVYEDTDDLPSGVSAGTYSYGITVTVTDAGDGTLSIEVGYPEGTDELEFKNYYQTTSIDVAVNGIKFLENESDALTTSIADIAGMFTFEITAIGDNAAYAPLPSTTKATNDASGNVTFGTITYDTACLVAVEAAVNAGEENVKIEYDESGNRIVTFTYQITERGSADGVTNDTYTTRTFTVTVTEDYQNADLSYVTVSVSRIEGSLFNFKNTYDVEEKETSITDQLTITKYLKGRSLADGEFTFVLVEIEGEDATVVATGTNDASGNVIMSSITYTEPGEYDYTLYESSGSAGGVDYSAVVYWVHTSVTDNGDGTLKVVHTFVNTDGSTFTEADFTNTYEAAPATVVIGAGKILAGADLTAGRFTFNLLDVDYNVVSTATNDINGSVEFETLTFTEAGTYYYYIVEVDDAQEDVTYDSSIYKVTVEVTDDGEGLLSADVTYEETPVFTNTYEEETTPEETTTEETTTSEPETEGSKEAKTGDESNLMLWASLLGLACLNLICLLARKKLS